MSDILDLPPRIVTIFSKLYGYTKMDGLAYYLAMFTVQMSDLATARTGLSCN